MKLQGLVDLGAQETSKLNKEKKMENKERVLAIDLGYSAVKCCFYNLDGVLTFEKFISATAKIPEPLEMDNDNLFRLGVDYYVLGTPALKIDKNYLMPLVTFEDMKAVYPVWISYLINHYKKDYGIVFDKVSIGLSMVWSSRADELLEYLYDTLLIEDRNFFLCYPQGLCCRKLYSTDGLDIRETSKHNDIKMRNFILVDGGFNTLDIASCNSGTAASSVLGTPNTGVINVVYDIIDYLFKTYEMKISVQEGQTILDSGGIFTKRGRSYDISAKVDEFVKAYLTKVIDFIEDKMAGFIDSGAEGILILGGLSYFFNKYISDPDVVKMIEKHYPVSFLKFPTVDFEYYNCISYLRLTEKMLENTEA